MSREHELLVELARATTVKKARTVVDELERNFGYAWRPVGDNEANYGLINIGSDPGHALIERVTNAIDAVIEREAARRLSTGRSPRLMPTSPREAVEQWFGVPGGRVANIPDITLRQQLADHVIITLLDGSEKRRPTVRIRDKGVGLTPSSIPVTILSLSGTNKIDKLYLAGAYGQGGSTTLAFSPEGTLFVSRKQTDLLRVGEEDVVAVTFARYEELDPAKNKNGRYAYLVDKNKGVPYIRAALLADFEPGTAVTHFNLAIERYAARVTQLTGSLWWLLQNALFDPVLPLWVEDTRESVLQGKTLERRTITGNYTRLCDDRRDRIEHSDSVSVRLEHPAGETNVRVHYWVVRAKPHGSSAQAIDSYVDPFNPIAYTYFGQTHGTDERRVTAERLQLPYLAKYLIIQVELDNLIPAARRELLSSTRDRLKRTAFFFAMRERVCEAIAADAVLLQLNDQRKEEILSHHSEKERERMKQRFAELMERLAPGIDALGKARGNESAGRAPVGSRAREPLDPLPTKDEPSFIRIANVTRPIPIRTDRYAVIRLESDAPDGYLTARTQAKLTMVAQPDGSLVLESKSDFRGGRARFTVRCKEGVNVGLEGKMQVFLFTPSDQTLSAEVGFRVEAPPVHQTSGEQRGRVKVPEPIPVSRSEWENFGWNEESVADVREDKDGMKIYVNADNKHLTKLLRSGRYQEQGITRMRNGFVLYVAFYAWARHVSSRDEEGGVLSGEDFEAYQAKELDRLARTVILCIAGGMRLDDQQ